MTRIVSTGAYLPEKIITNDYFFKNIDDDKFNTIGKFMTGMKERRHASSKETGMYMAYRAAKNALEKSTYESKDIDLVIGHILPNEYISPEDLNLVVHKLKCKNAVALPINTACSSFLTSLNLADTILKSKKKKVILVVTSTNAVNTIVNKDQNFSMFGDGAGAMLLDSEDDNMLMINESSDYSVFRTMRLESPVFTKNTEYITVEEDKNIDMIENQVKKPVEIAKYILNKIDYEPDWLITHQAGYAMIEVWRKQLELGKNKVLHTFDKYANMIAANIPVTFNHYVEANKIKRGDKILFFAPAAGAHYISILWQY